MNCVRCESTSQTTAYLIFGREIRTLHDVQDLRTMIHNEDFIPEITLYLRAFVKLPEQVKEVVEEKKDKRKNLC